MSTPLTFTVTHITDQVTKSGKTKVLLMCDTVDRSITLSALVDLGLFPADKPLAKWHRLTTENYEFADVETDYVDAVTGNIVALKKPRQMVWLNGAIRRQGPAPLPETTIIDEFDGPAPTTFIVDEPF